MIISVKTLDWFGGREGLRDFASTTWTARARLSAGRSVARLLIARLLIAGLLVLQIILVPTEGVASPKQTKSNSMGVALVMIEEIGCPYCARWHAEIGGIYAKTPEGQFAPLKTVFIHEDQARNYKRVVYTPTFIVMNKGKEVGRILGYTGENFFWPMLEELLKKAGYMPEQSSAVTQ